jgi:hypothetical protein
METILSLAQLHQMVVEEVVVEAVPQATATEEMVALVAALITMEMRVLEIHHQQTRHKAITAAHLQLMIQVLAVVALMQ